MPVAVVAAATPAPVPGPPAPGGGDRTGVTDTTIRIGIHAPMTGAAPFPQKAFDKGRRPLLEVPGREGRDHGRNVEVVFRDDKYNPTSAVQACREMVEEEKVFAIIGFAGSDQITACARYADSVNVPYFSGGVNEDGLAGLNRYFAISQTYDQQSATLVKLMKNKMKKTKVAIVVIATPALNNTVRSITRPSPRRRAADRPLEPDRQKRLRRRAALGGQQLRNFGAEVVYIIAAPIPFIKLATNGQAQAYNPTWVGPGHHQRLRCGRPAGCPSIGSAKFLSPFPQLDAIDELDPDYKPAYPQIRRRQPRRHRDPEWGLNKIVAPDARSHRSGPLPPELLRTVTSGKVFHSNVYPDVSYSGTIRFGAKTAHLLEADCGTRQLEDHRPLLADF